MTAPDQLATLNSPLPIERRPHMTVPAVRFADEAKRLSGRRYGPLRSWDKSWKREIIVPEMEQ
jgi:hypothetical protein